MKPMTTEEEYRNASVPMPKGPNDLEEIIRVLETRNEYLHKHIEKLTEEVHMLREDNVMLAKQIDDKVRKMRESGLI
jgi:predicted RNase H-like nuclease (RuvC/YqgF family)|tara:strand:+ start:404 stop:634 length:231 start_codon:yes stop_codon:yes gene_type:complete